MKKKFERIVAGWAVVSSLLICCSPSRALNLGQLEQSSTAAESKSGDSLTWIKYRESRGEHDCLIDENKNWLGVQRCAYSWECRGARQCQKGTFEKGDGWC